MPKTTKPRLVLWGKHLSYDNAWLKLYDYSSPGAKAELKSRQKEGWTLAILPSGVHPDAR